MAGWLAGWLAFHELHNQITIVGCISIYLIRIRSDLKSLLRVQQCIISQTLNLQVTIPQSHGRPSIRRPTITPVHLIPSKSSRVTKDTEHYK